MDIPNLWSLSPYAALVGLVVFIATSLIRGMFIPKSSHERELQMMKERGDEWRETATVVRNVNTALLKQNSDLIESNRITDHFFRSMGGKDVEDTDVTP